jgi:hypothetical protein
MGFRQDEMVMGFHHGVWSWGFVKIRIPRHGVTSCHVTQSCSIVTLAGACYAWVLRMRSCVQWCCASTGLVVLRVGKSTRLSVPRGLCLISASQQARLAPYAGQSHSPRPRRLLQELERTSEAPCSLPGASAGALGAEPCAFFVVLLARVLGAEPALRNARGQTTRAARGRRHDPDGRTSLR